MRIKQIFFEKDVATSGTPEPLVLPANEIYSRYFAIQAKPANTGRILIGDADSILTGVAHSISPGTFYIISTSEWNNAKAELSASETWVDAEINGDGVVVSYHYSSDKYLDP